LLLYGPPGTGKTQIGRTLANETGLRFIAASTADLKAGYVGQSGQKVRELFERARESSPCILFIDELDIVAPARGFGSGNDQFTQEIVGQLLQEMDGAKATKQDVFVLAATNRTDQVDPAVLSRFTRSIEIPLPDREGRERLFKVMLQGKPIGFNLHEGSKVLAAKTSGMSGRDIRNLIEQAEQVAVGRAIEHRTPHRVKIYIKDFPR
jgi:transitional endoplasmic reticulum ATPase